MGTVFVHTKGRGQYAATCQRDPGQRDGALNGAILPIFAMKDGNATSTGKEDMPVVSNTYSLRAPRSRESIAGNTVFAPKPGIVQQMLRAAGIVVPAAVFRDADGEDVVFVPIQMA